MLSDFPVLYHVLLPVAGVLVGVFSSFTGLGGTYILAPVLILVFGLETDTAVGCTLAQMIAMSVAGLLRHLRLGHISLHAAVRFLAGSLPAVYAGRRLLRYLKYIYGDTTLKAICGGFYVACIVFGVVSMILKYAQHRAARKRGDPPALPKDNTLRRTLAIVSTGLVAGFLAGLFGIGGGIIAVPLLAGPLGFPLTTAIGTSVFQMVFTAAAGTLASVGTPELDWTVIGLLAAGSVAGAQIGPLLLSKTADRFNAVNNGPSANTNRR